MNGTYTTRRDGGLVYHYEASCSMQGKNWHWSAVVRRADGMLAGKPNGVIYNAPSFVEDPLLKKLVEAAIEDRVGVD